MVKVKISKKAKADLEKLPPASDHAVQECLSQLSYDRLMPGETPLMKHRSVFLLSTLDLLLIRRQKSRIWGAQIELEDILPSSEFQEFVRKKLLQLDGDRPSLQSAGEILVQGAEKADRYKKAMATAIGIIFGGLSLFASQAGLAEKWLKGTPSPTQPNPAQVQTSTPPK